MRHVIAIDQGTTGSTVLVLDEQLAVRGRGYKEFRQIYPQPGWVEHDPEDIWASVTAALGQAMAGIDAGSIAAIGISHSLWFVEERAILMENQVGVNLCLELKITHKRFPVNVAIALLKFQGGMDGMVEFFEKNHKRQNVFVVQAVGWIVFFQGFHHARIVINSQPQFSVY